MSDDAVPLLTERVAGPLREATEVLTEAERAALLAEVQTKLTAECFDLIETMLDDAARQVENILYQKVKAQLRAELPEVIEAALEDILEMREDD